MTSRLVISSRTGRSAGTCSVPMALGPSGYANFHIHFLPITYTSVVFLGGVVYHTKSRNPWTNHTRKKINGMVMTVSSNRTLGSTMGVDWLARRWRYLKKNTKASRPMRVELSIVTVMMK